MSDRFNQLLANEEFQNELLIFESLTSKDKEAFRDKYAIDKASFIKAKTIIDALHFKQRTFSDLELDFLWDQLGNNIKKDGPLKKNRSHNFSGWFSKIAAILLIPLLVANVWLWLHPVEVERTASSTIVSPLGTRTQFTLPDGTKGWLNNGSTLQYTSDFIKKREVKLSGEAYFEVVKKNTKNFVVNTTAFAVEVLGTKFNVSAYPDDIETSVVLAEGNVKIKNSRNGISEVLNPDEIFTLNKTSKTASIRKDDAYDYIAWRNGQLRFRNEPLSEVLKKMGRWYNVEFQVDDQELLSHKFRANFQDETLEETLKMIALTTPVSYQIVDRSINKKGIYKKKKVIIKSKD